ncbi:uncharacterized protein LOC112904148 [Agrilus planipennis]|uniref:Uncharacterized protein LOC112904148 n=1 Tax=Agrilus planipennis TaxID=224129 RepID=A0A7F5R211_AGRPL|nr:uncharacterized protein LOC112904148 [Agrilus planipennis]
MDIIDNVGFNGRICLLKSICEIGQYPMHIEDTDSLLERIVHYLFTPSEDLVDDIDDDFLQDEANGEFFDQLLRAEFLGKTQGKCNKEFSECDISVISLFTKLFFTR